MIPGFGLRITGCDPKAKVVDLIPDALATESWKCGSLVVKAPVFFQDIVILWTRLETMWLIGGNPPISAFPRYRHDMSWYVMIFMCLIGSKNSLMWVNQFQKPFPKSPFYRWYKPWNLERCGGKTPYFRISRILSCFWNMTWKQNKILWWFQHVFNEQQWWGLRN